MLGYFSLAYISRMTRSLMLEQLGQDYIMVARAKGLSERRVLWRHALGNVLVPLATVATLAYANLLEGSVLTETVFAWPGIGSLHHGLAPEPRHERGDGRHPGGGGRRSSCSTCWSKASIAGSIRGAMTIAFWHDWLVDEAPASVLQARLGRLYATARSSRAIDRRFWDWLWSRCLALTAAAAPGLARFDPNAQDLALRLAAPGGGHWLGTDELGRDILSRLLYGSRVTLGVVVLIAAIVPPLGLLIGCVAGYCGGIVDAALMRMADVFLAFPRLILALALVAALGPGIDHAVLAIALAAWPPYARLARAETLALRGREFIAAARLAGASHARLLLRHIAPLCLPSLLVRASLDMAGVILIAAGLGFLGPWRRAADGRVGRDDRGRAAPHARPMVGRGGARPRHRRRLPRLQSARRGHARRARPETAMSALLAGR